MNERLKKSKVIDKIIFIIPHTKENDILEELLQKNNIQVFRGDENNVLKRYYNCSKKHSIKHILRVTSDCPLVDPNLIDKIDKIYKKNNFDYVSNIENRTFPEGMDLEFFKFETLKKTYFNVITDYYKEHVTKYILRSDKFYKYNFSDKKNFSNLRITLDRYEDYKLIKKIFLNFKNNSFSYDDILRYYKK